jgi:DNA primase
VLIDDKLFELINEKTNIVDLVSQYVELKKSGKNYMGLCPFHQEKTPSFSVSIEKNIAVCMSCNQGGTPITFLRQIKNISLQEAAFELAEKAGIEIKKPQVRKDPNEKYYNIMEAATTFYQFNLNHSEKAEKALDYLYKRQLTNEQIEHFRLGYAPVHGDALFKFLSDKNYAVSDMIKVGLVKQNDQGQYYDLFSERIIFPITSPTGHVVGFSGRTINSKEKVKYINSPETVVFKKGLLLYHYYEALQEIRRTKSITLYEGFFDVISAYAAGLKNGVATMGTALTKEQARLIKQATNAIVIAYDGDKAGLNAIDKALPILERAQLKSEVLMIPDQMDPDDFIKSHGPEAYQRLFGEYTMDPYQFRYAFYKKGKDLKNSNDMQAFKEQVIKMIQNADVTIQSFYRKKLAQDLSIEASDIVIKRQPSQVVEPSLPKKETTVPHKLINKYERSEHYIIFEMLRSKKVAMEIHKKLNDLDYGHHLAASLRSRVINFYEENDILDIEMFKDVLNKEERELLEKLLQDDVWKKPELYKIDSDVYIHVIKLAHDQREHDRLNKLIKEYPSDSRIDSWLDERDIISRRLKLKN